MRQSNRAALAICLLALAACSPKPEAPVISAKNANVDDARLLDANNDGANWMSYGRTYDEQRFSPLTQVDDKTVSGLGLAWSSDLDTARGVGQAAICPGQRPLRPKSRTSRMSARWVT